MKTKVILISGKARHGKDTTAKFLKDELHKKGKSVLIAHFSDLIKYVCKEYFNWNGKKDNAGRSLLQQIGTDIVREKNPTFWVDYLVSIVSIFNEFWDYVIIPDTRFPNEISRFKEAGIPTIHIRVNRGEDFYNGLTEEQNNHISEIALDNTTPDAWVNNLGTLKDLENFIKETIGKVLTND